MVLAQQRPHEARGSSGRVYNRTTFSPERRAMMWTWADDPDGIRGRPR